MGLRVPLPDQSHAIRFSHKIGKWSQLAGQVEHILGYSWAWRSTAELCVLRLVKAWPHDWLLRPFWRSAGPAKGPTGRQFGSRVVQVWPKSALKGSLSTKRGTWPKPCYLLCFRPVWVGLGRHWAARGRPWRPYWRQRAPLCRHTGTSVLLGSMETVANQWERTETDGNFLKPSPDQRSKSI